MDHAAAGSGRAPQLHRAGLAAEHALWRGDPGAAIEHVQDVLHGLYADTVGAIRIAATGLWAQADLAARARAAGDDAAARSAAEAGDELLRVARAVVAVTSDGQPRTWLGLEGAAWLARAEAERRRVGGVHDVDLWRKTADLFTYGDPDGGFVYEVARPAGAWPRPSPSTATGKRRRPSGALPWRSPNAWPRNPPVGPTRPRHPRPPERRPPEIRPGRPARVPHRT